MGALVDACGWLFFAGAAAWTILGAPRRAASEPPPWFWRVALFAGSIAFRWPMLWTPHDFSPDESQSLAGAITLLHDPRFWQSVDGATAGPLHYFAQVPAALFPAADIYFACRLTAIVVVLATLFVSGAMVRRVATGWVEQTVVFSATIAFAASRTSDFQHLSTELIPLLLIVVALWWAFESPSSTGPVRAAGIGALLALAPLAKLQAGPIALLSGLFILGREIRAGRSRAVVPLIAGALAPVLITSAYLTAVDAWPQAIVPYLYTNLAYVELGSMPYSADIGDLIHFLRLDGYVACWICISAGVIVLGVLWLRLASRDIVRLGWVAVIWVAVAAVCTLLPRRPFLHYAYLILPGWAVLLGCAIAVIARRTASGSTAERRTIAALLTALAAVPAVLHAVHYDGYGWERAYFARWHRENIDLANAIRPYVQPGDTMAIWGSRSDLYVLTTLPQAIPQAHSQLQISNGTWQRYYLRAYAEAFERNRPAIFVDAVGPGNFLFKSRAEAHEAFPYLAATVRSRYTLVTDVHGTRIYVRNDRIPPAHPPSASITPSRRAPG